MNIYEKIFTYIESKSALNTIGPDILKQYENSLIFIGDQKQIYQPLTNTYVGIGVDAFNALQQQINQSGNNLTAFNTYMHSDVVNHLYGQYSPEDLAVFVHLTQQSNNINTLANNNSDNSNINFNNYQYLSSTNRNVIVKGIYDYDVENPYSNTYHDVNITTNGEYSHVYPKSDDPTFFSYGTSGINVKVRHTGAWRSSGPTDDYPYGFSYWDGQDILTIDDKLTWSYIAHNTAYLKNYARAIAAEEANRIYHNLLGEDVEYISKNLNNILYYDSDSGNISNNNVYVKNLDASTDTGYGFTQVNVTQNSSIYELSIAGTVIATYDPVDGHVSLVNNIDTALATIGITLSDNDGCVKDDLGNIIEIIWYTEDPNSTSPFNYDLADGIQTIKEVAYILDTITDGDGDDGISIAYNIKQNHDDIVLLQEWQTETANPSTSNLVTSFNSSSNLSNFILLNSYSSSQGIEDKGDIKLYGDLVLAYTYIFNNVSYAAYTTGQIQNNQYIQYVEYYNLDDVNKYVCITDSGNQDTGEIRKDIANKLLAAGLESNSQITLYTKNSQNQYVASNTSATIGNILSATSDIKVDTLCAYIFYPYIEYTIGVNSKGILDGITTVDWVTTYVGHGLNDLTEKLNTGNTGAQNYTDQKIEVLDASYTAPAGKYVSGITQTDGLISNVDYTSIPQDIIYTDPIIANQDDFIKIPYNLAVTYIQQTGSPDIYAINNGVYTEVVSGNIAMSSSIQYYIKTALPTNKFKLATTLTSTPTTLYDLIGEGHNFFELNTAGDKNTYIPVDLQEKIKIITEDAATAGTTADYTLDTNPLYYIDFSTPFRFTKYIDGSTSIDSDGHTNINVNAYISYLSTSNEDNTGLADAYDVRKTIERMFTWIDLSTNSDFVRVA